MKRNNQLIVITHLSQLLDLVTLVGGLLVPLFIWITNKDKVFTMDDNLHANMYSFNTIFWFRITWICSNWCLLFYISNNKCDKSK